MITADYHVHSDFSGDGKASMEQMIEQAIRLGLKKLCFTDHMDYDYPKVGCTNFILDVENYSKKLADMKEKYKSKINVLMGIELGLQPGIKEKLTRLIKSYPFDFIIGSSHVVDHIDPFYPEYWENKTNEEGILQYFRSIIDNCREFNGFNVYGHLDYIIRYTPEMKAIRQNHKTGPLTAGEAEYNYNQYADILDEVLKAILSNQKGIEVNTAGYKYGLGYPHPKAEILKRYKELGGELITIGSDAHQPEHLCYDFDLASELLKSLGFRYYATFVEGKPVFEKI